MDSELKPCPFCGERVTMTTRNNGMFSFWHKSMFGDCLLSSGVFIHNATEKDAIEAWNRRVSDGINNT